MQEHNQNHVADDRTDADAEPSWDSGASRDHEGVAEVVGAPSSNRAPTNPISFFKHGTDSLFLSFQGELFPDRQEQLELLKLCAQSDDAEVRSKAQLLIGNHVFEVTDKGTKGFSFGIRDNAFFIKLGKKSKSTMPFASVQISSEYLSHVGNVAAYDELRRVLSELGLVTSEEKISRADLHVDFSSDFDFSAITSNNLVSRSRKFTRYENKPHFTGFSMGLGGVVGFRLYDKTQELKKCPRPYLLDMWKANGWDGKSKIWRAEFETKRPYLRRHRIDTVDRLELLAPALWEALTCSRLRIVHESVNDTHRERWTNIDVWRKISAAFPTTASALSLETFDFSRVPSPDYLFKNGLAGLTSYMAITGFTDPNEALQTMLSDADDYHQAKSWGKGNLNTYLSPKVEEKKKRYNKPTADMEANAE
jgi:hypothetical protein